MIQKKHFLMLCIALSYFSCFSISHTVDNTNDSGMGSLRNAIQIAATGDTILFDPILTDSTIVLTSGEILIDKSLTIIGLGYDHLSISGNNSSRAFYIDGGILDILIRDLEIKDCENSNVGSPMNSGGAIFSRTAGELKIIKVKFENNRATQIHSQGGVIFTQAAGPFGGDFITDSCFFFNNQAESWGGAISLNASPDSTYIKNTWFKDNKSTTTIGTIYSNSKIFFAENTTFSGNEADQKALIKLSTGNITSKFINCTFSDNLAANPGRGIELRGESEFINCTFTGNNEYIYSRGTQLTFQNNILDNSGDNYVPPSTPGIVVTSNGGNISNDGSLASFFNATNDLNNTNPMLDVFSNTGGIMHTHQLQLGSPAIDNGINTNFLTDQIGGARDAIHDAGAREYGCTTAHGVETITACISYTWIDGETYFVDNNTSTFTISGGASGGCDSIVTLDLTIIPVEIGVVTNDLVLSSLASNASYQWLDCDWGMSIIGGETDQDIIITENGAYAVEITQNGCKDTSECISIEHVGIYANDSYDLEVNVYPVPVEDVLNIKFDDVQKKISLSIVTIEGREVMTVIYSNVTNIPLELNLAKGIYLLELYDEDNNSYLEKIIVN